MLLSFNNVPPVDPLLFLSTFFVIIVLNNRKGIVKLSDFLRCFVENGAIWLKIFLNCLVHLWKLILGLWMCDLVAHDLVEVLYSGIERLLRL